MAGVFISYRRADSARASRAIHDALSATFKWVPTFMDVDRIPVGRDFRPAIADAIVQASVLVAVIGPGWLSASDQAGRRRLDNPADFVRLELEEALRVTIPVIVALVDGAAPPTSDQLPPSLASLATAPTVRIANLTRTGPDMIALEHAILAQRPGLARWRPQYPWLAAATGAALAMDLVIWIVKLSASAPGATMSQAAAQSLISLLTVAVYLVALPAGVYFLVKCWQIRRLDWWLWSLLTVGVGMLVFGLIGPRARPFGSSRAALAQGQ